MIHQMGGTFILIFNQSIYGGKIREDGLLNPIQFLQNDVKIDSRPRIFYPEDDDEQTIQFKGQYINIMYDGPLPYINVRRPTSNEQMNCTHFDIISPEEWNPYSQSSCISNLNTGLKIDESLIGGICSISTSLMTEDNYYSELLDHREIRSFYVNGASEEHYRSTNDVGNKYTEKLSPEQLAAKWGIGIKTARRTLKATTYPYVKTVGYLT